MESMLQPPPPFCFEKDLVNITSGNLSNQWSKWKKSFFLYFKACQLHTKDKEVQVSILLHIIGDQCRDVYETFTAESSATVESVLKKFDGFFTPKKNLTVERHKFFIRNQQEHESVEQYAFELNKCASTCEFGNLKDDLVKDRLICGLVEDALRERLLREYDLTLKKALDICNVAEMSRMQAGTIKTEQDRRCIDEVRERDKDTELAMHWVQRQRNGACSACQSRARAPSGQRAAMNERSSQSRNEQHAAQRPGGGAGFGFGGGDGPSARPSAAPQPYSAVQRQRVSPVMTSVSRGSRLHGDGKCDYCGNVHEKFKCPAYGQRCAKCKRMNHFARVCRVYAVQENSIDQDSESS